MQEHLGINPRDLLIQMGGFLVLLWLLRQYLFDPISKILEERGTRIKQKMDEAERHSLEMKTMRDEYEQRIAKIETEARDRIQAAMKEAQAAKEEMLDTARTEAEKLIARGKSEAYREKQKALVEMRDQIADLAIQAASRVVEKNLDEAAHRELIDDIIEHGVRAS